MKKSILIVLLLICFLSGCVYQAELRPKYNDTDVWICEEPYIELCWSKSNGQTGLISYADIQYDIMHREDYGSLIWVYTEEAKLLENTDVPEEYWVFKGHVDYGKDKLEIEVREDFKNIFNGELPTLKFKRHKTENNF